MQGADDDDIIDVTVILDGTGAKCGFMWETGHVLDYEVLSKYCHECRLHEGINQSSSWFQVWWGSHEGNCSVKFVGSSTAMMDGCTHMEKVDSKSKFVIHSLHFRWTLPRPTNVLETNNLYGVPIVKHDCVGHVQRWMGSRLEKQKQEGYFSSAKWKKVSLGRKGHLTEAVIDSFRNYYGAAIRRNARDVKLIYYHSISADAKPQHQYCPKDYCWAGNNSTKDNWHDKHVYYETEMVMSMTANSRSCFA